MFAEQLNTAIEAASLSGLDGLSQTLWQAHAAGAIADADAQHLAELIQAFAAYDADDSQRCLVLTGSEKAFAAGADIKEMSDKTYAQMFKADFFTAGARAIEQCRKPIIAAVAGYALGGGCELALACHVRVASEKARLGTPEVKLGIMCGFAGTQRQIGRAHV